MINPLDKLFKDKLVDHSLPPSSNSWARVEAGLSKKNNGLFRLRIAAAVLLLTALTATFVWLTKRNASQPIEMSKLVPEKKQVPLKEAPPVVEKKIIDKPLIVKRKKRTIETRKEERPIRSADEKQPVALPELPTQDQSLTLNSVESPATPAEEVNAIAPVEKTEKPIVIEYRLEAVTTPAAADPQLTASAKEKSGFRKVLDFAIDAKNSSPLGDLREAKDGLLAFNKKDKQTVK